MGSTHDPNSNLGVVKLNSSSLTLNGMTYSLKSSGALIKLSVKIKAGEVLKGTAKSETLNGTKHSDIFYGGKGNDTINCDKGRDVVVYDKNKWGKDTITKSRTQADERIAINGSVTLIFNGLTADDIKTKLKSGTMTITRKSDANQSITIKHWDSNIHNIVYADGMTNWNKYLKAAKPTVTAAVRNEVFKKAGLAQA